MRELCSSSIILVSARCLPQLELEVVDYADNQRDCGATHLTEEGIRKDAKVRTPDAAETVDATDRYGCFAAADFEKTIKIDVETLRSSKVLAGVDVRGLALDTETGLVRELEI